MISFFDGRGAEESWSGTVELLHAEGQHERNSIYEESNELLKKLVQLGFVHRQFGTSRQTCTERKSGKNRFFCHR